MTTTSTINLPLRTAIIGLSASAITSWAASAHLPSLLTPHGEKDYQITALCNSSVSAAKAAIKAFGLPSATKAYGSPLDLANDADIDIVINCTRVDKHYETSIDSVKKGKRVYIEWPVTSALKDTEELLRLAKESGSVVAVGLQGRWAPPVLKLRELLHSRKLGKVLSSDVRAFGGTLNSHRMPVGLKYFGEKVVGGNPMTIGFAHCVDYVQSVVGDYVQGTTHARTQIQRPSNQAFDPETKEVKEEFTSDVPDLIIVTGSLEESQVVEKNATLSVTFRRGQPFKGQPALTWTINCENAEICLIVEGGVSLQAGAYDGGSSLSIHWFEQNTVEEAMWSWDSEQEQVPVKARSVMKTLYAFAEGNEDGWTSLESATKRAQQIDAWLENGTW